MPEIFSAIPRDASRNRYVTSRAYDPNDRTNEDLNRAKTVHLPEGSTVWLIAVNSETKQLVKNSYVVHNSSADADARSYLMPCNVNDNGDMIDMEGSPLYLKSGKEYLFYAISPARKLDSEMFARGTVGFQVKNGEYFYANDCRYDKTTPITRRVEDTTDGEAVQEIELNPMVNQTAELKFQIDKGHGVHDLDIQPSGIEISGLQNDSPEAADGNENIYGNSGGLFWHMSQSKTDEPISLQHGDKFGIFNSYDYTIDTQGRVNIEVPVLPMWSLSKPVIVIFRLKVNGVPTSYEMMLNEKDFKAGYSYGYRGKVSISDDISVITWQYISWETSVEFPFE